MFPKIMGVLNVTPNSFSDGNADLNLEERFAFAEEMIKNGVDIIDIGGESTKPYSEEIPINIELDRVLPILKKIRNKYSDIPISIDTRKAEVANECLRYNVNIINDVSGLQYDEDMSDIIAKHNASLVIMHSKGDPKTMQNNPTYENVVAEVYDFLKSKIEIAKEKKIEKIICDVGIGFGKTLENNIELLKNIGYFETLNVPILLGISRKNFIKEITGIEQPIDRDFATMILHTMFLRHKNINIIRVHNVNLAMQIKRLDAFKF